MSTYQLRHFDFYGCQPEPGTTLTSCGNQLLASDCNGNVHILDVESFQAFDADGYRVTQLVMPSKACDILVTVGEQGFETAPADASETTPLPPIIKVWELERAPGFLGRKVHRGARNPGKPQPYCLKSIKITTFAISESLSHTAIGLEDGQVVLIRGNIVRDRFTKQRIIHACSEPITGLGFSDFCHTQPGLTTAISGTNQPISYFGETPSVAGEGSAGAKGEGAAPLHLFVATTRQILVCSLAGREEKTILDEQGCGVGCAAMVDTEFHRGMTLGRDDPRGERAVLGLRRDQMQHPVVRYPAGRDVALHPPRRPAHPEPPPPESRLLPTQLEIYDVGQKLVGFSKNFPSGVRWVVWAFMGFFVLCQDGELFRVEERDTRSKLEVLLSQDLYHLAITIATHSRRTLNLPASHAELSTPNAVAAASGAMDNLISDEELAEIYRKYGDFLYSKGDYESAMSQYLLTLGQLEPSYVIRKVAVIRSGFSERFQFLDAQRLRSLTTYLQQLHGQGLANPDHTTLLLNCYTKLKDAARLEAFIKASAERELPFDLETALRVLRQAGFYELALYLARNYRSHEWYLQIQVENRAELADALNYMRSLPATDIKHYMHRYGRALVKGCPEAAIQLLLDVCSGGGQAPECSPLDFSTAFVDHPPSLMAFLEQFCALNLGKDLTGLAATRQPPTPKLIRPGEGGAALLWNTLLDLYLTAYVQGTCPRDALEAKIMGILTDPEVSIHGRLTPQIPYDVNHAIVLCKLSMFGRAIVFLYEKLGMYVDIINHWMAQDDAAKLLEALRKFGPREPALYTLALEYFATSPASLLNHPMEFRQVLDSIDDQSLLPPVQVLQALSRNSVATIGNLKQFVKRSILADEAKIAQDAKLIESYRQETERKRNEVQELETSARVFQHTKCSSCSRPLDLPALHFLCRHSFHQRCLGQPADRCPLCFKHDQLILDLRRRQEAEAYDHAEFLHQLEGAGEDAGFDVVTHYLAKSTFQFTSLKE
ncbi:Vacuolar protein sorting-associated protein 11 [Massospora cicadina]|nr:Vacuolar protein sorting-associated protein 11 [Massospora cicadina]